MTKSQQWVLSYLKGKDWTSPTEIGGAYYKETQKGSGHSSWASPHCLRLVESGMLVRNEQGHYKIKS